MIFDGDLPRAAAGALRRSTTRSRPSMSQQPTPHPDEPTPAQRPGGPKTPEGKARSRRNALKHGLRAKVLTPDAMIDDVRNRTTDFTREFRPTTTYQEWLVGEIALATVRIDRCAA